MCQSYQNYAPVLDETEADGEQSPQRAKLTVLPAPSADSLHPSFTDDEKSMLHSDAAACVKMMGVLGIRIPKLQQARQYTAGLVSWTGRFIYPATDRRGRSIKKAGEHNHAAAAASVNVAAQKSAARCCEVIDAFDQLAQKLAQLPAAEQAALRARCSGAASEQQHPGAALAHLPPIWGNA